MSEAENLVVLEELREMALVDGLTHPEREAVYRLAQDMLGVKMQSAQDEAKSLTEGAYRLRQWAFASVALSAVAFVVSLVAVLT